LASRKLLVWFPLGALVVVGWALFGGLSNGDEGPARRAGLIAAGLVWAAFPWAAGAFGSYKTLKRSPNLRGTIRFQFDEEGYRLEGPHASAELKWAARVKWKEAKHTFLLYSNPRIASVIPKRFFQSPADVDAVRSLLQTKVQKR
jgi:hypothetical protein